MPTRLSFIIKGAFLRCIAGGEPHLLDFPWCKRPPEHSYVVDVPFEIVIRNRSVHTADDQRLKGLGGRSGYIPALYGERSVEIYAHGRTVERSGDKRPAQDGNGRRGRQRFPFAPGKESHD